MDYQEIIERVGEDVRAANCGGQVATYIPELGRVPADKFGIQLMTVEGDSFAYGDCDEPFSIQSISKVFLLTQALNAKGRTLWQRLRVEPSGDPFNSLVQLEYEQGIPRNPFINAGAIVVCDVLLALFDDPRKDFRDWMRRVTANPRLDYNERIAESERAHGYHNRAIANLMKAFGNIEHEVEAVLDFYFFACSIKLTCAELARAFLLYANHGRLLGSEESILSVRRTKRINALMQTCGLYDEAGEYAFRVGLPGKSGVGGGVAAVFPGKFSVAVWSPPLNPKGNSTAGILALERLTDLTGCSIF